MQNELIEILKDEIKACEKTIESMEANEYDDLIEHYRFLGYFGGRIDVAKLLLKKLKGE
jgi:hypothetical protein